MSDLLHRLIAYAAVAAALVGVAWSLVLVIADRPGGARYLQAQAAIVAVYLVAAASGGLLLLGGSRPSQGFHLLYAGIAVVVVPLARSFIAHKEGRPASLMLLASFVVLAAVTYRLFATG